MLVLEKDKKEAAIEEDFEKALQCKKEIKELQAKIEETKDQLMKLFQSFNSEVGQTKKPKQDKDMLLDILEYEASACKLSKGGKCELVLTPYLLEMHSKSQQEDGADSGSKPSQAATLFYF